MTISTHIVSEGNTHALVAILSDGSVYRRAGFVSLQELEATEFVLSLALSTGLGKDDPERFMRGLIDLVFEYNEPLPQPKDGE